MIGIPITVGTILSKTGTGTSAGALTSSYTRGTIVSVAGIGALKLALAVGKDGAADVRVRLMDYSDPAHPRQLRTDDNNDPASQPSAEHVYTAASTVADLFCNLGGVVDAIALEAEGTGAGPLTANDLVTADLTLFDGPVR